jgi:hypothetical protein
MPQGQRKYADFDQVTSQPQGRRYGDFDQATGPQPEQSFWENLQAGAAQGLNDYILSPALSIYEAGHAAVSGDFRPLGEMAELAGRGLLKTVSAFDPAGNAYEAESAIQDPKIQAIQAEREKRHRSDPGFEDLRIVREQLAREAAANPSFSNKAARFIGSGAVAAAPAIATGVLSGGSVPAVAATTALQSAAEPQNLALNVGLATAPVPSVKALASPILKRISPGKVSSQPALLTTAEATGPKPILSEIDPPVLEPVETVPNLSTRLSTKGPKADFEAELSTSNIESLVAPAERTPILETIAALRKAGLLTSAKTHLRNVGGNLGFQLSEEASRIPARVVDMALSTVTKRRTISGPSLQAMGRSAYEAANRGRKEALDILRNGVTADGELAKLGVAQEIRSGFVPLDKAINFIFRSLSAEDRLFRVYAYRRSIEDRARVTALNEMRQGAITSKDVVKRAEELAANPSPDMVADSLLDAEVATFNEPNRLAEGISAFKAKQGPVGQFAVDMLIPFPRTPSNIIRRLLEYSPLGFGKNAFQVAKAVTKKAFTEADQRAFAQMFGRASIGSGLIALGAKLYDSGLMTGLWEDSPSKRNRDTAAGRTPGSILIGDGWHQITGFSPLGNLLAIGATMAREENRDEDDKDFFNPAIEALTHSIGEAPLMAGVNQMAESLTRPGSTGEKLLGGAIGSFVPTIASDVAEAIDPAQREPKGILGQTQKRIPGLRQTLPEAVDVTGQAKQDYGPGQALAGPTKATTDVAQSNPIFAELVRIDAGISGFRQKSGETPDNYRRRVQAFGRLYSQYGHVLINSPQYRAATDAERREVFRLLNDRSKTLVDEAKEHEASARLSASVLFGAMRQRKERKER